MEVSDDTRSLEFHCERVMGPAGKQNSGEKCNKEMIRKKHYLRILSFFQVLM